MATVADKRKQQEYINKAREMEDKYGIPPYTLVGLLKTESEFNPKAVSKSRAKGIAQFMDQTAKAMNIDPYNTDQSIEGAAKYLNDSYKRLGNWEDTVLSYNMGVAGVKQFKAGKKKQNKEQAEYTQKVFNNRALYYTEPKKELPKFNINDYTKKEEIDLKEKPRLMVKDNAKAVIINEKGKQVVAQSNEKVLPKKQVYFNNNQPYYTKSNQITSNVNNFEIPQNNITFASVPEVTTTTEKKVDKDIQEVEQKTAEQKFLEEASQMFAQPEQQYTYQEQEDYRKPMETNVIGMYNFANNFVAQQGGEKIIDDNMGQYNHPGKVTRISSPYITMKDVPYDILAVADNGEKRIMKPNEEHYFKNAKTVTEYPILTEAEKRFLNEINNG